MSLKSRLKENQTEGDVKEDVKKDDTISKTSEMSASFPFFIVEIFDIWGIDFIGHFPSFFDFVYILVAIDYVSNWVEALATRTNDHKVVMSFVTDYIFC